MTSEKSSDRPIILVMPFANQSGNKEYDYFGNGMTSHLITTLSQYEQFLVLGKALVSISTKIKFQKKNSQKNMVSNLF